MIDEITTGIGVFYLIRIPIPSSYQTGENSNLVETIVDFTFKKVESGCLLIGLYHKFLRVSENPDMFTYLKFQCFSYLFIVTFESTDNL